MMRVLKICLLYWLCSNLAFASVDGFLFVPFNKAMNIESESDNKILQNFEQIYQQRNPNVFRSAGWAIIPKKIHQVWLYNTAIPLEFTRSAMLWKEMLPDWEYKLWLLEDINNLDFSTKDLYRKSQKIAEKLDIVKFELLNKFGGVYVDIDCIPIQNISYLNNYYKFYVGLDPFLDASGKPEVSTSFLGSRQDNLFLHKTLVLIRDEWHKQKYYKNFTRDIFNKVVRDNLDSYNRSIVFPASYFSVVLLDHPLISFMSKYIFFKNTKFFNKIHKETMVAKQKY